MKIDPAGAIRSGPVRRNDKARSNRHGDFAKEISADSGTPAISGSAAVQSVDAVFALQEVDASTSDSRQARARGQALLDQLDRIRLALLEGVLSQEVISDLKQTVGSRRAKVEDPRLAQVLDEIDLRAEVELAKLSRLP